jgi:hypothetical protein
MPGMPGHGPPDAAAIPMGRGVMMLLAATAAVALVSELLVYAILALGFFFLPGP